MVDDSVLNKWKKILPEMPNRQLHSVGQKKKKKKKKKKKNGKSRLEIRLLSFVPLEF